MLNNFLKDPFLKSAISVVFVFFAFFFFAQPSHAATFVSGVISVDTVWTLASSTYVVQGLVTINPGITLTIEPGVVVKFGSYPLTVNGTLNVNGTPANKVYFTSLKDDSVGGDTNGDGNATSPASQDWTHIQFNSGSSGNLNNTIVRYAGKVWCGNDCFGLWDGIYNNGGNLNISNSWISDNNQYGVYQSSGNTTVIATDFSNHLYGFFLGNGTVSISESSFHDNALGYYGYGIYANDGNLNLINNTLTNNLSAAGFINGSVNFIHSGNSVSGSGLRGFVMAGVINENRVWNPDLPYIISSYPVTIDSTKTLTIEPGAVIKFDKYYSFVVNGNLNVNDTPANKVYFPSLKDDSVAGDTNGDGNATSPASQDWTHIQFNSGSNGNIANVVIRYGGRVWCGNDCHGLWDGIYNNGGSLNISNSQISDNNQYGIYQNSGSLSLVNSEVNNNRYGAYIYGGAANLSQNSFHDNSDYAVFNSSPTSISAPNNWWGSDSGPYHPTLNPSGTGNRVSDNVNFIPWLGYDPENNQPLSFKAASLAKQVVNHQEAYLKAGKGWDYNLKEFVDSTNLLAGYNYKKNTTGIGVDCSGLVMWTYDRSFDKNKPASDNFVNALTANEQYIHNTTPVAEPDLRPGDVMFFDFDSTDGPNHIDHVAMYVGESSGYDVVSAVDPALGIAPRSKDLLKNVPGFVDFKKVTPADPLAMEITSHSPVDLIVTDPDGFTIGPDTIIPSETEYLREIPDVLYYSEMEQGPDGNPIDRVYSYTPKTGDYKIQVIPDPDAPANATYSLDFTKGNQTVTLSQDVPISQIPQQGYGVTVVDSQTINTFIPVSIDIKPGSFPNSINLGSNGVVPVAIFGLSTFDVKQIDFVTIKLGSALIKLKGNGQRAVNYSDVNKDGFTDVTVNISTEALQLTTGDIKTNLEGRLKDGTIIKGSDSIRIVPGL